TITGKGFRSGKNKNTVVFKRAGQRAVFVKAESATTTKITLHVPLKLQAYMPVLDNQPAPGVFAIRIISKRFGQKFTGKKLSPTVGPAGTGSLTPPGSTLPSAYEQRLAAAQANPGGDISAYSDGTQNTGGQVPTAGNPTLQALDLDHDGNLTDDERDADNDGLSNMVEYNTTGTQNWWEKGPYKDEKKYFWRSFAD